MENNDQQQYQAAAQTSRSSSPASNASTSSSKPLPSLPLEAPSQPVEPYQDEPSTPIEGTTTVAHPRPPRYNPHGEVQTYFPPYTDAVPGAEDNDDVPLAHLYPYPTEAPPAYNVAVRQSYRDTLISHIPSNPNLSPDADEEAGVEMDYYDDNRFKIERVVAAMILSVILMVITAFLIAILVFHKSFFFDFKWA